MATGRRTGILVILLGSAAGLLLLALLGLGRETRQAEATAREESRRVRLVTARDLGRRLRSPAFLADLPESRRLAFRDGVLQLPSPSGP